MENILANVRCLDLGIYIRVTERPKKKVTIQVVSDNDPGNIKYDPDTYNQYRSRYIADGWKVTESRRTSSVYILKLNEDVKYELKMINHNQDCKFSPVDYLYVGMTGLTVDERISNHVKGVKSCSLVKKYYLGVFGYIDGLFHYEAEKMEKLIPRHLRELGYWVYQA